MTPPVSSDETWHDMEHIKDKTKFLLANLDAGTKRGLWSERNCSGIVQCRTLIKADVLNLRTIRQSPP